MNDINIYRLYLFVYKPSLSGKEVKKYILDNCALA